MFAPFAPLSARLLTAFVESGRRYFVRQACSLSFLPAGSNNREFMFMHYPDIAFAQEHMGAIEYDPYRFLYSWDNPDHQQKLFVAASQPEGYTIWSGVFRKDWERLITKEMEARFRRYIGAAGWKPSRSDLINPQYYLHYGHLYVQLKFRSKELRVKFEEIETLF